MATDEYCTCNETPEPIYEEVANHYATPSTEYIDYTEKPHDCQDIKQFYETVNVPNNGYIKKCTTDEVTGLIGVVEELLVEVVDVVDDLTGALLGFKHECGIVTTLLDGVLDKVRSLLSTCHTPLHAVTLVDELLGCSTRYRQLEHSRNYLEKRVSAAHTREQLLGAQKNILGKHLGISRNIDNKMKNCGSGGLLNLGNLLGGSCTRDGILSQILGLNVLGLVGEVLGLVRQVLLSIGIDLRNLELALNLCLRNLLGLELELYLFEDRCPLDEYENRCRHEELYPLMTHLQNHHTVPIREAYTRYSNIINDEQACDHYLYMSQLPLREYKIHNHQIECPNLLDISANILGLIDLDLEVSIPLINCIVTGILDLDLDVEIGNLASASLQTGANEYLESLRVVTMGMTGCEYVKPELLELDITTGLFKVSLNIGGIGHQLLSRPLIDLDLDINLNSIVGGVGSIVGGILGECNSYKSVETLREAIQETHSHIHEKITQGNELAYGIENQIQSTQDYITSSNAAKDTYLDKIYTSDDVYEQATQVVNFFEDHTKRTKEEYKCSLQQYERAVLTAEAHVLSCQNELLDAKLKLALSPNDQSLINICAALEIKVELSLKQACFIRDLYVRIQVALQAHIGLLDGDLLDLCVDIRAKVELLGIKIQLAVDLKLWLGNVLNLNSFLGNIGTLVGAVLPTVTDLNLDCLLDDVLDVVKLRVSLFDECQEGELPEHMRHRHSQVIKSAVAACAQNPHVHVEECQTCHSQKRSAGDIIYEVTISDPTTTTTTTTNTKVDFATQENGMTATTATTSSASSLVSSFLILFVSILCFF